LLDCLYRIWPLVEPALGGTSTERSRVCYRRMITLPGDSANAKKMQLSTVPVFSNLIEAAALCVRPRS